MNTEQFFATVAEMRNDAAVEVGKDFDDLEELVRESHRTIVASQVKTLDDLDLLLAESIELRDDADSGAVYRKQLAKGGMTKEEKLLIEQKLQEWESRREWETVANVALFRHTTCACGAVHNHFVGLYYRQVHRTLKSGKRIVAAKHQLNDMRRCADTDAIPNETLKETRFAAICEACAFAAGFDVRGAKEVEWKDEQ